jgi:DNA repair protein RecN (Recombination protein N)
MTREIRAEGRSIARINGHNVSLSVMHEIGEYFVDIHGQSEHLSLLNPRNHIHILDRFAMNQDLLKVYHEKLKKLQTVQRQLKSLRVGEEESLRQKDMLTFQINEIESAKISENEEVDLIKERDRLGNIENLSKYIRQSIQYLEGNNTEIPGIIDLLGLLTKSFENLVKNDSDIQTVSDTVFSISEQANEIYDFLQHYQDRLEFNPHRLEQIEERLMIINGLKRKYGGSIPNVLSFALKAQEKLSHLENSEEEIENLVEQEKQLLNELSLIACQLSEKRIASARKVSQDVEKELGDLHMANAKFQVSMTTREDENGLLNSSGQRFVFNENGFDEVEFLIAPNPGEGLKPLSKIASGGETSRLMLALKNSLASADAIPTLVFDEIDQGIGGRIGSIVGEKIWNISRNHQVLCITHLPQLAAFFDVHFHVSKEVINGRTRTIVQRMDRESSIHEMASLLGSDSEENILAAEAMLKDAETRKSKKK